MSTFSFPRRLRASLCHRARWVITSETHQEIRGDESRFTGRSQPHFPYAWNCRLTATRESGVPRRHHESAGFGRHREALNAAMAIGDDRLQKQTQGRVVRHSPDHRSSEVRWQARRRSGNPKDCETFSTNRFTIRSRRIVQNGFAEMRNLRQADIGAPPTNCVDSDNEPSLVPPSWRIRRVPFSGPVSLAEFSVH
jgi:hypothetical protein